MGVIRSNRLCGYKYKTRGHWCLLRGDSLGAIGQETDLSQPTRWDQPGVSFCSLCPAGTQEPKDMVTEAQGGKSSWERRARGSASKPKRGLFPLYVSGLLNLPQVFMAASFQGLCLPLALSVCLSLPYVPRVAVPQRPPLMLPWNLPPSV